MTEGSAEARYEAIVDAIDAVLADAPRPVPLHAPLFDGNEAAYVNQCVATGWVSTAGAFVERFERELAAATGARFAVATCTGTAALHAALLLQGVGPGDEVIVPALTFVATANAVAHCGAVPHFADVESYSCGLDPDRLASHLHRIAERRGDALVNRATGRRVAAIVPVHCFGRMAPIDALVTIGDELGLPVIEDAAEALGSTFRQRHAGTFGRCGVLSFNGNKIVTAGGGGAILTDDAELAAAARHLTSTARLPHAWRIEHDRVAYNYRMPNLNAALATAQLERLPAFLAAKHALAGRYDEALRGIDGAELLGPQFDAVCNHWLNTIRLNDPADAEPLLAALHARGILARPAWTPMHRLPMFGDCPRDALTVTEALAKSLISLPSGANL